jgi:HEAT repeat protein
VYVNQNNPQELRENEKLEEVLIDASRERSATDQDNSVAELRSTAAFALGVLGSERSLERLRVMLDDGYANARFNAAVALCRNGDAKSLGVLLEMIDPESDDVVRSEPTEEEKQTKRLMVMQNGIRAVARLAEKNSSADLSELEMALERVAESPLEKFDSRTRRGVRVEAEEALYRIRERARL